MNRTYPIVCIDFLLAHCNSQHSYAFGLKLFHVYIIAYIEPNTVLTGLVFRERLCVCVYVYVCACGCVCSAYEAPWNETMLSCWTKNSLVSSIPSAILWVWSHIAGTISHRVGLFEHAIYSWDGLHCSADHLKNEWHTQIRKFWQKPS